ncbi:MAG: MobC family plasmid mobilization relaxosome protein [Hyphomicrobiaceae bacterium]|nr:MAG: MobC family plasmid mobilization relaxosome protein [Hyphomicrobiaceae bacterium]
MEAANENTKRDRLKVIRCSRAELAAIEARATAAGLNASDFIRRAALGHPVEIIKLERLHPADLAQLKRLGNLLNQIARAMHRGRLFRGTIEHAEAVMDELRLIIRDQLSRWKNANA